MASNDGRHSCRQEAGAAWPHPIAHIPIEVKAGIDLIVHIESEQTIGAYTPLGCVAISTARERAGTAAILNEMDILTGE